MRITTTEKNRRQLTSSANNKRRVYVEGKFCDAVLTTGLFVPTRHEGRSGERAAVQEELRGMGLSVNTGPNQDYY